MRFGIWSKMYARFVALAAVGVIAWACGSSCTPGRHSMSLPAERPDAVGVTIESAACGEGHFFPYGEMPTVRLRLRNNGKSGVQISIQESVSDFWGREVHRSSQRVELSPRSVYPMEWPLPIAALGYFEATFRVEGSALKPLVLPLVILPADVKPGYLEDWPAPLEAKESDPRRLASALTCAYLERLASHKGMACRWHELEEGAFAAKQKVALGTISTEAPPHPVVAAVQTLKSQLEGAKFRRSIVVAGMRAYRFFKEGETGPTWVIWAEVPCGPVVLRPLDDPVVVTDLMGNSQTIRPTENSVIFLPSRSPLFVRLSTLEVTGITPIITLAAPQVEARLGQPIQVSLEGWNPFKDPLTMSLSARASQGWTCTPSKATLRVEQGQKQSVSFGVAPDSRASSTEAQVTIFVHFSRNDLPPAELQATIHAAPASKPK